MTSDTKTNQGRVALWDRYVVQRAKCVSRRFFTGIIMPNTNCCMPLYHATSKRHTQLSWHALPIDPKLNKQPTVAISNDTLKVNAHGTSECVPHFQGELRTHDVNTRLRYSLVPFKKLLSKLLYVSHTNECCIFAIARRRLLELTRDSLQSLEKVTGAPYAVTVDFCWFECVGLQQLLELLLRS